MNSLFTDYIWVFDGIGLLLLGIFFSFLLDTLYKRLLPHLCDTGHTWDDTLLEAVHRPLKLTIWIIIFFMALHVIDPHLPSDRIVQNFSELRSVALALMTVWFLMRFVANLESRLLVDVNRTDSSRNPTTIHAVSLLTRIVIISGAVLSFLQILGIPISGVLAFGGIGGIGVALAAKDSLANFFGGMMIFIDRPFQVGDWIRSPDKDIEGTVEHIGWRLTRIRTFDKRPRYVPNGVFSNIIIDNPSRMLNRRILSTIGLRYDDAGKLREIIAAIKHMIKEHPDIDSRQYLMVNFIQFSPSSLDIQLYCFTKTVDWARFRDVRQDVLIKAIDIIAEHGAECAFPTQTLHMPEGIKLQQPQEL